MTSFERGLLLLDRTPRYLLALIILALTLVCANQAVLLALRIAMLFQSLAGTGVTP